MFEQLFQAYEQELPRQALTLSAARCAQMFEQLFQS